MVTRAPLTLNSRLSTNLHGSVTSALRPLGIDRLRKHSSHAPPPVDSVHIVSRRRVCLLRERARRGKWPIGLKRLILSMTSDGRKRRERKCGVRHPSEARLGRPAAARYSLRAADSPVAPYLGLGLGPNSAEALYGSSGTGLTDALQDGGTRAGDGGGRYLREDREALKGLCPRRRTK
jgi:hypothetical protein